MTDRTDSASSLPTGHLKGVWIPKWLWEDPKLSWREKCLLAYIGHGCSQSNGELAKAMGVGVGRLCNVLVQLQTSGHLLKATQSGTSNRILRIVLKP